MTKINCTLRTFIDILHTYIHLHAYILFTLVDFYALKCSRNI